MSDLLQYLFQILLWVVALMSGFLSLARELLLMYRGEQVQQRTLFWNCVIIAFVVSATALWVIEHRERLASDEKVKQLTQIASPKLSGTIESINTGERPDRPGQVAFMVIATVKNVGAPSIADRWDFYVTINGVEHFTVKDLAPSGTITLNYPEGPFQFRGEDALYSKSLKEPLQNGAKITGILLYHLDVPVDLAKEAVAKGAVRLTFVDITDHEYTAANLATETGGKPLYYPGLKQ